MRVYRERIPRKVNSKAHSLMNFQMSTSNYPLTLTSSLPTSLPHHLPLSDHYGRTSSSPAPSTFLKSNSNGSQSPHYLTSPFHLAKLKELYINIFIDSHLPSINVLENCQLVLAHPPSALSLLLSTYSV